MPLPIEETLYRIAQEALHNIVKHAAAKQVRLDIRRDGADVLMSITDDGKGFDPASVPDGHLGLAGMRARADRIGATFTCISTPGNGATVAVTVPRVAIDEMGASSPPERLPSPAGSASIRDG